MILTILGGTGSLARAIIRQEELLLENGIKRIRVISRDEQKQIFMERNLLPKKLALDCFLGDVTDLDRMKFALNDADYVIHTAALKHVHKFELDVRTGFKTNILGTQNVAEGFLGSKNGESAIFASTDKAALPITSYGVSKLAAEKLWLWFNTFQKEKLFKVARFGNQFGSRGSVVETWTKLAKEKKPLPITDKECTRFFIMIDDAAEFVLNSLFHSHSAISIPTMRSASMVRLAEIIWDYHNPSIAFQLQLTGMRQAEKVHEVLEDGGKTSDEVERFSDEELRAMYKHWLYNEYGAHL